MSKTAILQADLARRVAMPPAKPTIKSDFMLYGREPRRMWIYKVPGAHMNVCGVTWSWEEALAAVCAELEKRRRG